MGCSCGGRAGAVASTVMSGGTAAVYRLFHPNGSTVDYWDQTSADKAKAAKPGSYWALVDHRTGLPVG